MNSAKGCGKRAATVINPERTGKQNGSGIVQLLLYSKSLLRFVKLSSLKDPTKSPLFLWKQKTSLDTKHTNSESA